ncbi:MAG: ABC transporter ATP-binding protein [Lentisphaerota bacterium]
MNNIISVKDVYRTYKLGRSLIKVLRGVDLEIVRGEWLAMLGASGSGKTTLLNLIGGLEKPDNGKIFYDGVDIGSLSKRDRCKLRLNKIGYVFQSYHLLPELSILENAALPARLDGKSAKIARTKAEELLVSMGLKDRLKHRPVEVSGGEQQRTAIARALVNDPDLLLADEPTGNLDSATGQGILEIFKSLHNNRARTIIMVTHNTEVAGLSERIIKIKDGKMDLPEVTL